MIFFFVFLVTHKKHLTKCGTHKIDPFIHLSQSCVWHNRSYDTVDLEHPWHPPKIYSVQ